MFHTLAMPSDTTCNFDETSLQKMIVVPSTALTKKKTKKIDYMLKIVEQLSQIVELFPVQMAQ